MNAVADGLYYALAMAWQTFWALVLGFTISAALQIFVSKERISRVFGRANLKSVTMAMGFGAASSSCSYAAAAAGRSALVQGAALVPMLAFMFASTNLVIELGAVLWLLLGWRFVAAEVAGAFLLVGIMWGLVRFFVPKKIEEEARKNADRDSGDSCCHEHGHSGAAPSKMRQLASAFVMDWQMLWKEIVIGFLIAGLLAAFVPSGWWRVFFLENGPAPLRLIENAIVGPLIAMASFVCSVGNLPLASLLWSHGISFGGVISFIYADLIVIPLVIIYFKYYGARAATAITLVLFVSMVLAGIAVDLLFSALHLVPTGPRPPSAMRHAMIHWNYTSWLDCVAAVVFLVFLFLYFRRGRNSAGGHCH